MKNQKMRQKNQSKSEMENNSRSNNEIKNTKMENLGQINTSIITNLEEIYENQDSFWKEFKENEMN